MVSGSFPTKLGDYFKIDSVYTGQIFMKRPLLISLIYLITGILCAYYTEGSFFTCLLFLFLLIAICPWLEKITIWRGVWLFPLFYLVGSLLGMNALSPKDIRVEKIAEGRERAGIYGLVTDSGHTASGAFSAVVRAAEIVPESQGMAMETDVYMIIYFDTPWEGIAPGSYIYAEGPVTLSDKKRNPGGFNQYLYDKNRGIDYRMYADRVRENGRQATVNGFFYAVRNKFASVYDAVLPARESALMKSMIMGDKSGLDEELRQLYKDAGLYHIIVVSGLHISIIILLTEKLLRLFFPVKASVLMVSIVILFYCMLTGASPATLRAAIMALVVIIGRLFYRDGELITSTSFACMLLLLWRPLLVFDPGFQLSFAAMSGIAFGAVKMETFIEIQFKKYRRVLAYEKTRLLWRTFAVSASVFLFTLPVVTYHFNYLPLYTVVVNVLLVPFCSLLVGAGFLMGIAGIFSAGAASILSPLIFGLLTVYENVCLFFVGLPGAKILVKSYPLWLIGLFYAVLCLTLCQMHQKEGKKGLPGPAIGAATIFILCVTLYEVYPRGLQVTMLDVGQGDCTVIEISGKTFVIDGGGQRHRETGSNTGARVLVPYLDYRGVETVDTAFVSHVDADHVIGIIELVAKKEVKTVVLPVTADKENHFYELLEKTAIENGTDICTFGRGDNIRFEDILFFETLWPFSYNEDMNANDASLVIRMQWEDTAFLFTGDAGFDTENALMDGGAGLQAQVLKLGHHGSKYATSAAFLEEVSPALAVAGVSRGNAYGHPSVEVRERLDRAGVDLYATSECGAVVITVANAGIKVQRTVK